MTRLSWEERFWIFLSEGQEGTNFRTTVGKHATKILNVCTMWPQTLLILSWKWHRIFAFQFCFLAFLCSDWMMCATCLYYPQLPLSHISCKPKVFWHFIRSLVNSIPWRLQEYRCSAFLLHSILMRNHLFSLQELPWSIKRKKNICFHSNFAFLWASHKLKPRGHKYHRVFLTEHEMLCCNCTQKGWNYDIFT